MRLATTFLLLAATAAAPAWAVAPATVDAVQMPAWVTRAGRTEPLAPGMEMKTGDVVRTGEGAKAYLKLADGSTVKLGQAAQMTFHSRGVDPTRAFRGALDVVAGAFRYTTDALRRVKSRNVMIRVGTATAGIRGTDLWGRSNEQEDLICLIKGAIEVSHGGQTIEMDQPLSFFVAPKGQAAQPVAAVEPEKLQRWSRETEIEAGDGAARRDGRWALLLGAPAVEAEALTLYDTAREAGYAARIRPVAAVAGWTYEVRVPGFPSSEEAAIAARWLKVWTGIEASPGR